MINRDKIKKFKQMEWSIMGGHPLHYIMSYWQFSGEIRPNEDVGTIKLNLPERILYTYSSALLGLFLHGLKETPQIP